MSPALQQVATTDGTEPLAQNLCWLLSRATQAYSSAMAEAVDELGISARAHQVLVTALSAPHTQSELARIVGLDKTTMVVTVDELEAAGLAERRPSPNDRRARVIGVTKAGEAKVREAAKILDRVQGEVLASLPTAEREPFLHALRHLAHSCQAGDDAR